LGALKGTVLRREIELAMRKAGIKAPEFGDAHAFLRWTYRHPGLPFELRLKAAIAAAPYEKPRLSSTRVEIKQPAQMTDDELAAFLAVADDIIGGAREGGAGSPESGTGQTWH
jgi:hypothetical protein